MCDSLCDRVAKEAWDCDISYSAGVADGSPQFHAGLVFQVSGSTDPDLEFEVTDEYFTNSDGSTLGYGTDYPHLKRKVHITHTSAHHPVTYIASRYIVSLVLIL